ncbi:MULTISPECIES: hypothetical protein [Stenotrophomonas]|jgi:hypothetical protein|uniref:hypothetical protein n=1 Tax=Stenotrophomonas TaxID=40323 RepID=UPI0015D24989|nr:hypothetical protein [Stenotrophomonas sp. SbOxS2]NYT98717.1 hypothetical protein [Stenotrophomonas sp. SbOxS2]CAH0206318.1 hypothetical protein SRABI35_01860 [Stenotrophomonas lactitubi]
MSTLRVFVDFNNRDPEGLLRLNLRGTLDDLWKENVILEKGMSMIGSDGDLVASIIVVEPGVEGIWRGRIVDGPWEDDSHK